MYVATHMTSIAQNKKQLQGIVVGSSDVYIVVLVVFQDMLVNQNASKRAGDEN